MTTQNESQESLTHAFVKLFEKWLSLLEDLWTLLVLELQLAGKSLVFILILSIAIIFLSMMLWIFLMAAGAAWLVSLQLSWIMAFLIIAALHFAAIIISLVLFAKAKYRLTLPETRKQLGLYRSH